MDYDLDVEENRSAKKFDREVRVYATAAWNKNLRAKFELHRTGFANVFAIPNACYLHLKKPLVVVIVSSFVSWVSRFTENLPLRDYQARTATWSPSFIESHGINHHWLFLPIDHPP
jgi:hypothetical protein